MCMYNINMKGYVCLNFGCDKHVMFVKARTGKLMSERAGKLWLGFSTEDVFSKFY